MMVALKAHDGSGLFIQNGGYECNVGSLVLILAGGRLL